MHAVRVTEILVGKQIELHCNALRDPRVPKLGPNLTQSTVSVVLDHKCKPVGAVFGAGVVVLVDDSALLVRSLCFDFCSTFLVSGGDLELERCVEPMRDALLCFVPDRTHTMGTWGHEANAVIARVRLVIIVWPDRPVFHSSIVEQGSVFPQRIFVVLFEILDFRLGVFQKHPHLATGVGLQTQLQLCLQGQLPFIERIYTCFNLVATPDCLLEN
mmetsp:Transcript_8993/g.20660  ORF Transcript_8993/g.20660 Transcript_8993/m.20660 type:complete len:215 (-) Transcript_8993:271-915(-)